MEECNVMEEAAEVSVSTLTQVSETPSEKQFSIREEFAKATTVSKREGATKHVYRAVEVSTDILCLL